MAGIPADKCAVLLDMLMDIGAVKQRANDNRLVLTGVEPDLAGA